MNSKNQKFVILSPFILIILGFITAKISFYYLNTWAWVPVALIYWTMISIILFKVEKSEKIISWIKSYKGKKTWAVLAIIIGLIPSPILIFNYHLFNSKLLIVLWLLFALINPFFEEFYWRGLLLDYTNKWNKWISIIYSTILFVASHPLMWGVFSIANRNYQTIISLTIMGLTWSLIYKKTQSLRWPILSHIMVDIFNISVLVFLNIYIPPNM